MKNIIKVFGIFILALVIGFTITACDDSSGSSDKDDDYDPNLQTVATPAASPSAGAVTSGTKVTVSCSTAGAEIWYTTNGNTPAKNGTGSTKYTATITVNSAVTIKAIAVKDGMNNSQVLTAAYTISGPAVWVDPCKQTTQLTGGQTLLTYTAGNASLSGSPYGYETWDFAQGGGSTNQFKWYGKDQGGGGAYKADWTAYFLARLGYYWGNGGPYTQYKNIYVDYNYKKTGSGSGGFIGVYGWSRNPSAAKDIEKLIEYYIVEDWFWDGQLGTSNIYQKYTQAKITEKGLTLNSSLGEYTQSGSDVTFGKEQGSFTVDGATYKVYTTTRLKEPSIDGDKTFIQIFSVRQGAKRTTGTISVTKHLQKMNEYVTLGNMYEAKFKVETFGGTGSLDLTYLYLSQEDTVRPTEKICNGNCGEVAGIQIFGDGFTKNETTGIITLDSAGSDKSGVIAIPVPSNIKGNNSFIITFSDINVTTATAQFVVKIPKNNGTISSFGNWWEVTEDPPTAQYPSLGTTVNVNLAGVTYKDYIFLQHNNHENTTAKYSFKVVSVTAQ